MPCIAIAVEGSVVTINRIGNGARSGVSGLRYSRRVLKRLEALSWPLVLLGCATLGLAPFVPEPHIWEKLGMLAGGELHKAIDIFDLLFHGSPWILLVAKSLLTLKRR